MLGGPNMPLKVWVAVKELKLSYHNMGMQYVIGFPYYSNLV